MTKRVNKDDNKENKTKQKKTNNKQKHLPIQT